MFDPIEIREFCDITDAFNHIDERLKETNSVKEIEWLQNRGEQILEFTHSPIGKKCLWGSIDVSRKTAKLRLDKVNKMAKYRIAILTKKLGRRRNGAPKQNVFKI